MNEMTSRRGVRERESRGRMRSVSRRGIRFTRVDRFVIYPSFIMHLGPEFFAQRCKDFLKKGI